MAEESKTPLLDELEKGPWPSFVTDIKKAAKSNDMARDVLLQLERSYVDKIGHWKHGGIVGVRSYGGGVIGRYSDLPEEFPNVEHFHTIRVNMPSGWFYTTEALRKICDIWEEYGSRLTNMHGSTGDIILLGTKSDRLQEIFNKLSDAGFDLGGSGSALRTPSACVGQARCEFACYDTLDCCNDITHTYQDELHRPMWPYKFKFKFSGCPNDCVASIARSDCSVIGTWRDDIRVDADAVADYADKIDMQAEIVNLCPTKCITWDAAKKKLTIDNANCTRCMHCINLMSKALRPGKDTGATLLLGGKAPILEGALLAHVIFPFIKMDPPYTYLKDFAAKLWDWWDENAKFRERLGEMINRVGMRTLLRDLDIKPTPEMISFPRYNPYVFWWPEELPKEHAGGPLKK